MDSLRSDGIAATAGHTRPVAGFPDLRVAHHRAELALSTLTVLGRYGELLEGDQLGYVDLLLNVAKADSSPDIIRGPIQALLDHDGHRAPTSLKQRGSFWRQT